MCIDTLNAFHIGNGVLRVYPGFRGTSFQFVNKGLELIPISRPPRFPPTLHLGIGKCVDFLGSGLTPARAILCGDFNRVVDCRLNHIVYLNFSAFALNCSYELRYAGKDAEDGGHAEITLE